ncbi:hypothetical protein [Salinithrix halophila]|uniref:WYL domain-containing protein n=1 Tax=Salinithrix halophila TaxID=1485204 RepID=A0ABV8JGW1_9BACL
MRNQVIVRAARCGGMVRIIYMDDRGEITRRCVRILSLDDGGVRAWCRERKAFRRFRWSGVLAAEPVNLGT